MMFRDLTESEIEIRVGQVNEKGVSLLLFKDARVDMNILDETVGEDNWQNRFYEHKGILFCSLGINTNYANKDLPDRWVWKDDAGAESNQDAEKGNASDARKRSGTAWGIGRCLYTAPPIWVHANKCNIKNTGKTNKFGKPIFTCNDKFKVERIVIENKRITAISIINTSIKADKISEQRCFVMMPRAQE